MLGVVRLGSKHYYQPNNNPALFSLGPPPTNPQIVHPLWLQKQPISNPGDLAPNINLLDRFWMALGVLGSFQPTAFIFSLDHGRKSNLVGDYRGDRACILRRNAEEGTFYGGLMANISPSDTHLRHTLASRTLTSPRLAYLTRLFLKVTCRQLLFWER